MGQTLNVNQMGGKVVKHIVGNSGEPAYQNGWTFYNSPWEKSYFCKTADGVVTVSIMVKSGTVNGTIFTLPVGYRPAGRVSGAGVQDGQVCVLVDISQDGAINTEGGNSNGWLAINMSFIAA